MKVAPSSDHHGTMKVAPSSDHVHTKKSNNAFEAVAGGWVSGSAVSAPAVSRVILLEPQCEIN